MLAKLPINMPTGIENRDARKKPTPTRHRLAIVSFWRSPVLHNRWNASSTPPGEGRNLGSIAPNVVINHQSTSGIKIDAAMRLQVREGGMSSANRQKVVDRRDFTDRVGSSALIGLLVCVMAL